MSSSTPNIVFRFCIIFIAVLSLAPVELYSQQESSSRHNKSSTFAISVHYLHIIPDKELDKTWNANLSFGGFVKHNYYDGNLIAGIDFAKYNNRYSTEPSFFSLYTYIGWECPFYVSRQLTISPALTFGLWNMQFEAHPLKDNESVLEMEFAISPWVTANFNFTDEISSYFRFNPLMVFTKKYINEFHIAAGIQYYFTAPKFVSDVLK